MSKLQTRDEWGDVIDAQARIAKAQELKEQTLLRRNK